MKTKSTPTSLRAIVTLSLCFLFATHGSFAQQYQLLSNGSAGADTVINTQIINSYSKVNWINYNQVKYTGPYAPVRGDRVLIIQMTGIDSGSWQWDTVIAGGNPFTVSNLHSAFDTSRRAKIQVVKVPQYKSLYIKGTGRLTAAPWNDSTGGILTFMVRDTFKIDTPGRCDVTGLGFLSLPDTTSAAAYGVGGAGGAGGAIGQNGGDSALVIGSGVGGGGDGGQFGQYGANGDTVIIPRCPGCGNLIDSATNVSLKLDSGISKAKIILGGAGTTGHGGRGGRGGGGGGGGTAGPGTAGGAGGHGGRGGRGGNGGGIILYSAGYLTIPDSIRVFYANGANADSGQTAGDGLAGGMGGPGLGPCSSGPGGGGRGASGGNGGDGGDGGGGGIVYGLFFHPTPHLSWKSLTQTGGIRGKGGHGGHGGPGGQNGIILGGGQCTGATQPGSGPDGDDGVGGNNGNNGTGAGGGGGGGASGGGPGVLISPCTPINNYLSANPPTPGYLCPTDGYGAAFEAATYGGAGNFSFSLIETQNAGSTFYSLSVVDGVGCQAFFGLNAFYASGFSPEASYDVTPTCVGASDGVLTIHVGDGIGGPCGYEGLFNYVEDANGNILDSNNVVGLSVGAYTVVYGDNVYMDTIRQIVNITEMIPYQPSDVTTPASCSSAFDGTISLTPNDTDPCHDPNYLSIQWYDAFNNYIGSGDYIAGLAPGVYTAYLNYTGPSLCDSNIWITENLTCQQTYTAIVTAGPDISASNTGPQIIGDNCGTFDPQSLGLTGGEGVYNFSINSTSAVCVGNASEVEYTTYVYDNVGCSAQFSTVVDYIEDDYGIFIDNVTAETCPGASNGTVAYTITDLTNQECNSFYSLSISGPNGFQSGTSGSGSGSNTEYAYPAGTYNYTISGQGQCSTPMIGTFTVQSYNVGTSGTEDVTICANNSLSWNGTTYSQTGTYSYFMPGGSAFGCDSTAYLNLTVLDPITQTISTPSVYGSGCSAPDPIIALGVIGGDGSYIVGNYNYSQPICNGNTTSTPYTVDITDGHNCTAQLSGTNNEVIDEFTVLFSAAANTSCGNTNDGSFEYHIGSNNPASCSPQWTMTIYDANNNVYTSQSGSSASNNNITNIPIGSYTFDLVSGPSSGACLDHTGSGAFNVLQGTGGGAMGAEYDTICSGSILNWNGSNYSQAGNYSYLLPGGSVGGCDSMAMLYLYVNPVFNVNVYDTIASGQTVTVGSSTYSATGIYSIQLASSYGCDSTIILYLTVTNSNPSGPVFDTICAGQSVSVGSHQYTATGTYTDTLTSSLGADSIILTDLFVRAQATGAAAATICQGQSYNLAGNFYTTSGTYTGIFTSQYGCDSIVTLVLTVSPPITGTVSATICQGLSYSFAGNTYNTTGTYTGTFTSQNGCDSIVTLSLTVSPPLTGSATAGICQGQSFSFAGNSYNSAGIYTGTFTAQSGCDSVVTLTLSVTAPASIAIIDTICDGGSHVLGGTSYTTSGTYTYTAPGSGGSCDTLQTLYLTVLPSSTPDLVITVSHGPAVNGQQVDTFRASYLGCDGAYYSWYLNLQPVGQHDSLAVITHLIAQGDSIVCRIDCDNRCASTTYTYSNRIRSGISDQSAFISGISVYPNPNAGSFTVDITSIAEKDAKITVTDVLGQAILSDYIPLRSGDNKKQITLADNIAPGIYIVGVTVDGQTLYQPVSIEK